MKIALCGRFNTDIRYQGGSAEVFLSLAKGLSKKHEITLFGRGKPTKEIINMCKELGIKYFYIPSDSYINILIGPVRAFILLRKKFDNFDIIHTHTGSYAIASIFFRKKSKIVTHVHEVAIFQKNNIASAIYLYLENLLLMFASKNSDLTITISNYTGELIKKGWKIKNIKVIPNGTNVDLFKFKKNEKILEQYGKKNYKLLFVGRLTRSKGILELIDSFKYLKGYKIKLIIIGYGELYSKVIKIISLYSNNIKLISNIRNKELPQYYSSANLVIVPSHYESAGLVPLEALSCGTPVLLANNTALREIKVGYFINVVEPKSIANSIKKVMRTKLISRKECRDYIEKNHTWGKIIDLYQVTYNELLKSNK
jgi:glycosyltransferase involved in cell wall biosynthesis